MNITQQIEAVYRRAVILQQYAVESPVQQPLLEKALQELNFVLEELQASQEELEQQNQELIANQQTIELERQRYQTLFDLAPNGHVLTDLQGNIQQANHYAATLLFCTPQEYLINKPLILFIHEPERSRFQMQLAKLTPEYPWEVTLQLRDGSLISVSVSLTRIKDVRLNRDLLLWSFHDITLRKQMEGQLQRAHDALEQRVEERTQDLKQLEAEFYRIQRLESLGMLVSGIIHDLNGVLTPILLVAEMQLRSQTAQDNPLWQMVQRNTRRGADLLQQLLLFVRGQSANLLPLPVNEVFREFAETIHQIFPRSIQICIDIPLLPPCRVRGDRTQIYQVLMNLCVNARDAMPAGGILTLKLDCQNVDASQVKKHPGNSPGPYVVLTIADTGVGIASSMLEQIFEPFFTAKAAGQGTGLGLSTVFRIVKNHGGFIEVSSEENRGTQFQIFLPALLEESVETS